MIFHSKCGRLLEHECPLHGNIPDDEVFVVTSGVVSLDKYEAAALYQELSSQWITRDNVVAMKVVRKLRDWLDELDRRSNKST